MAPPWAEAAAWRRLLGLARLVARRPHLTTLAISDRFAPGGPDPDPVRAAARVADACGVRPLLHVAGSRRTRAASTRMAARARALGLETVLLTTGDPAPSPPVGPGATATDLLALWRQRLGHPLLGAVVDPFASAGEARRREMARLAAKLAAGADFLVTQAGFRWQPYRDLRPAVVRLAGADAPPPALLGGVVYLPPGVAGALARGAVAGLRPPPALLARVRAEATGPGRIAHVRRLAVQIAALRALGYDGAHVAAVALPGTAAALLAALEQLPAGAGAAPALTAAWDELIPGELIPGGPTPEPAGDRG